jgi:hypothetical protein
MILQPTTTVGSFNVFSLFLFFVFLLLEIGPAILSVSGCIDNKNTTASCPLTGGSLLTIKLRDAAKWGLSITVGSNPCTDITLTNYTMMPGYSLSTWTCILPAYTPPAIPLHGHIDPETGTLLTSFDGVEQY